LFKAKLDSVDRHLTVSVFFSGKALFFNGSYKFSVNEQSRSVIVPERRRYAEYFHQTVLSLEHRFNRFT
jgi:hypothetical protein